MTTRSSATLALLLTLTLSPRARADCAAPSECICPSLDPAALIEGRVVALLDSYRARLEVLQVHPATAATTIPFAPGTRVDVARHAKSGELAVGGRVLAPVFHHDFGAGTSPGDRTWEIADLVALDADDHVTCSYAPAFRLSRQDALQVMLLPAQQCHQELAARGVGESYSCGDEAFGCMAAVGGGAGRDAGATGWPLLVLLGLFLAAGAAPRGPRRS